MIKVLITPGDSMVSLAVSKALTNRQNLYSVYGDTKANHELITMNKDITGFFCGNSVENLKSYIIEKAITHILPFGNYTYWALHKDAFEKDTNAVVISNSNEACRKTMDYFTFIKTCKENGLPIPQVYHSNNEIDSFPLIARSRDRKEIFHLKTMREVYNFTSGRKDMVVQKHVPGIFVEVDFIKTSNVHYSITRLVHHNGIHSVAPIKVPIAQDLIDCLGLQFGTLQFVLGMDYIVTDAFPSLFYGTLIYDNVAMDTLINIRNFTGVAEQVRPLKHVFRFAVAPSVITA